MTAQATQNDMKACLLAVLFGVLLPLSMAPFNWWPLGIVSIAGLTMLICGQHNMRTRFIRGFCFGFGVYAIGASWIYVSIHDYGQASVALSLLLITPFICFLALLLTLPFIILGKTLNTLSPTTLLLVFPSLWVLGEWFRGWAFTGFPWLYLGYGHTDTWLSGWAPILGALGVSWITAFCGALLAYSFRLARDIKANNGQRINLAPPITGLVIAFSFWFSGNYFQTVHWTQPSGKPLSIGLIQPATPLAVKWDPHKLPAIFEQFRSDTELLLHNDVVV